MRVLSALDRWPPRVVGAALAVALFLSLWLLRERHLFGDSGLLLYAAKGGWQFVFPETGASYLMQLVSRLGPALQTGPVLPNQALSCLCGVLAAFLLLRTARLLVPKRFAPLATLFMLSGGLIRIFAGHVEVYALLLVAVSAYLWLALACIAGRGGWLAAALAAGVAVWIHAAAVCLLPSLALLPLLARSDESGSLAGHATRSRVRKGLLAIAVAAVPTLIFALFLLVFGHTQDLLRAVAKGLEVLGQDPDPAATRWWVRGWGGEPSLGTDVVFLSVAHLKYLVNAAHILAPAALPVLVGFAASAPRRYVATPVARFLCVASLPCVAYACLLRPFWGPFDWDLFAIAALCLSALSIHLLASGLPDLLFRQLATCLVGFQLLFVSIPFLAIGRGNVRDAGPFVYGAFHLDLREPARPPPERLARWL